MNHTARLATEKAVFRPALPLCSFQPEFTGDHMADKKTYSDLLKDPRWQKKRLEILARDEWKCQSCYDSETTLHVHHKHYHKGHKPWEYEDRELVTLCENCHEAIDDEDDRLKDVMSFIRMDGPFGRSAAISMLAGWAYLFSQDERLLPYFEASKQEFRVGEVACYLAPLTAEELRGLLDIFGLPDKAGWALVRSFIEQHKPKTE